MGLSNVRPTSGELTAIRWEVTDRVATVWLHRPHRHNAWTGTMHTEFRQVMADLEHRDDVRAVVVTGTPPAFCVGGDSKALTDHGERGGYDSGLPAEPATPGGGDRLDADMAWQLGYRLPIIAAVNGACAGVGLSLVLFCDLRFVAAAAKLTTAAPKLGLPAEYGASWMLPRLVGVTRANDLLLSGRVVTGAETADWGLWNGVEADGEATLEAARALRSPARGDRRPERRHDDQAPDRRRSPAPRSRRLGHRFTPPPRRSDGHRRVPRRRRRPHREAPTHLLSDEIPAHPSRHNLITPPAMRFRPTPHATTSSHHQR